MADSQKTVTDSVNERVNNETVDGLPQHNNNNNKQVNGDSDMKDCTSENVEGKSEVKNGDCENKLSDSTEDNEGDTDMSGEVKVQKSFYFKQLSLESSVPNGSKSSVNHWSSAKNDGFLKQHLLCESFCYVNVYFSITDAARFYSDIRWRDVPSPDQAQTNSGERASTGSRNGPSPLVTSTRSTRSQNPEFLAKHRNFLQKLHMGALTVVDDSGKVSAKDTSKKEAVSPNKRKHENSTPSPVPRTNPPNRTATSSPSAMPNKRRRLSRSDSGAQDGTSDRFCWVCHLDNIGVSCETCPRVFHLKCVQLEGAPTEPWVCPECVCIMHAENIDTRSRAMSLLTVDQFCMMLKFAVNRMKTANGAEPFGKPVDSNEFPHYREYIAHPMDFAQLERNIRKRMYGSTEAFLADTKWILHNSIIFNSYQAKLTAVAKSLIKICKQEMSEIETCPDCYLNAHTRKDSWFVEVCRRPHTLVWAKLKGFPFWPAKAMKVTKDGSVDVRFFGAHDRAWVPMKECFLYSREMPAPAKSMKKNNLEGCIKEVELHIKKLREKHGAFVYAPHRTPYEAFQDEEQLRRQLPNYQGREFDNPPSKRARHSASYSRNSQERSSPRLNPEGVIKCQEDSLEDATSEEMDSQLKHVDETASDVSGDAFSVASSGRLTPRSYQGQSRSASRSASRSSSRFDVDPLSQGDEEDDDEKMDVDILNSPSTPSVSIDENVDQAKISSNPATPSPSIKSDSPLCKDSGISSKASDCDVELRDSNLAECGGVNKVDVKGNDTVVDDKETQCVDTTFSVLCDKVKNSDSLPSSETNLGEEMPGEVPSPNECPAVSETSGQLNSKCESAMDKTDVENDDGASNSAVNSRSRQVSESSKDSDCSKTSMGVKETPEDVVTDPNEICETTVDSVHQSSSELENGGQQSDIQDSSVDDKSSKTVPTDANKTIKEAEQPVEETDIRESHSTEVVDNRENNDNLVSNKNVESQIADDSSSALKDSRSDVTSEGTTERAKETVKQDSQTRNKGAREQDSVLKKALESTTSLSEMKLRENVTCTKTSMGNEDKNAEVNASNSGQETTSKCANEESAADQTKESFFSESEGGPSFTITDVRSISEDFDMADKENEADGNLEKDSEDPVNSDEHHDSANVKEVHASSSSGTASSSKARLPVSKIKKEPVDAGDSRSVAKSDSLNSEKGAQKSQNSVKETVSAIQKKIGTNEVVVSENGRSSESPADRDAIFPALFLDPSVTITVVNESTKNAPPKPKSLQSNLSIKELARTVSLSSDISLTVVDPIRPEGSNKDPVTSLDMECESDNEGGPDTDSVPAKKAAGTTPKTEPRMQAKARKSFPRPMVKVKTPQSLMGETKSPPQLPTQGVTSENKSPLQQIALQGSITMTPVTTATTTATASKPMVHIPASGSQASSSSGASSTASGPVMSSPSLPMGFNLGPGMTVTNGPRFGSPIRMGHPGVPPQNVLPQPGSMMSSQGNGSRMPQLQPRPLAPLTGNHPPATPAEAGPVTAELSKQKQKLCDFMHSALEEILHELSSAGSPEATIKTLQLELEKSQWRHQQELAELKHNTDLILMEMRASMENEKQRSLAEVRRQCEMDKQRAVEETKKKQWCAYCGKEALFYCCWNTSYCDYPCQQAHWPRHMSSCAQNVTSENSEGPSDSPRSCGRKEGSSPSSISPAGSKAGILPPPYHATQAATNASDSELHGLDFHFWSDPPCPSPGYTHNNSNDSSQLDDKEEDENSNEAISRSEPDQGSNWSRNRTKRKRCGMCKGCAVKENCGVCAPCRNVRTHQVCRERRCENLMDSSNSGGAPKKAAPQQSQAQSNGPVAVLPNKAQSQNQVGASYGPPTTGVGNIRPQASGPMGAAGRLPPYGMMPPRPMQGHVMPPFGMFEQRALLQQRMMGPPAQSGQFPRHGPLGFPMRPHFYM